MSFYFPGVDETYIFKRKGTEDDPFLSLVDIQNVNNEVIVLKEIPSFEKDFVVKDSNGNELSETKNDSVGANQYRVDYSVGIVYFHNSQNSKEMRIEYTGMGWVFISASRVMMMSQEGDPLESLEDLMQNVSQGVETLEQVGNLEFIGDYNTSDSYKKWNFVTYENKTYVAVKGSKGVLPSENRDYWKLVSSGVSFVGVYDSSKTYNVGDMVTSEDKNTLYVSLEDNNNKDLDDSSGWDKMLSLDSLVGETIDKVEDKLEELSNLQEELMQSDIDRDENESERESAFIDLQSQLELFKEDVLEEEKTRNKNESERKSNESNREQREIIRQNNENSRQDNENSRKSNEEERTQEFESAIGELNSLSTSANLALEATEAELEVIRELNNENKDIIENTRFAVDDINNLRYVGEFREDVEYVKNNIVRTDYGTFIALTETKEENPDESEDWGILSVNGKDGTSITVEGISADENGNISLNSLGLATENQVFDLEESLDSLVEVQTGELSKLKTVSKDNLVSAINELKSKIDDIVEVL